MSTERIEVEYQAEVLRIKEVFLQAAAEEAERMAVLLASKQDHELLGQTEFEMRDRLLALGARTLEQAVNGRGKKGVSR